MCSDSQGILAVEAQNLGKCFHLYDKPSDRLHQGLLGRWRRYHREFWALRHLDMHLAQGDSLAIIGRNGSGKSTLLQLICGTLTPTEGSVRTQGRVAALLELGSGFNPEFTGLENLALNGALLGMSEQEVLERQDDILAFADIGEFVHQPVKTYSSGMVVRLAFAVLAHAQPDLLIIDEALAVGDAIFVQKCMRFIRTMAEERSLLFVSHDAEAIKSLCRQAIWLKDGHVHAKGSCQSVSQAYTRFCQAESSGEAMRVTSGSEASTAPPEPTQATATAAAVLREYQSPIQARNNLENATAWTTGRAEIEGLTLHRADGSDASLCQGGEELELIVEAHCIDAMPEPVIGFLLKNRLGQDLFGENTLALPGSHKRAVAAGGRVRARFRFWMPPLPAGRYAVMVSIANGNRHAHIQHHWAEDALVLTVSNNAIRYGLIGTVFTDIQLDTMATQSQTESKS